MVAIRELEGRNDNDDMDIAAGQAHRQPAILGAPVRANRGGRLQGGGRGGGVVRTRGRLTPLLVARAANVRVRQLLAAKQAREDTTPNKWEFDSAPPKVPAAAKVPEITVTRSTPTKTPRGAILIEGSPTRKRTGKTAEKSGVDQPLSHGKLEREISPEPERKPKE